MDAHSCTCGGGFFSLLVKKRKPDYHKGSQATENRFKYDLVCFEEANSLYYYVWVTLNEPSLEKNAKN